MIENHVTPSVARGAALRRSTSRAFALAGAALAPRRTVLALLTLLALVSGPAAAQPPAATVTESAAGLAVQPAPGTAGGTFTVAGRDGIVTRRSLGAGESILFAPFDDEGRPLPDGWYRWELRLAKALDPSTAEALAEAAAADDEKAYLAIVRDVGGITSRTSGRFRVQGGSVLASEGSVPAAAGPIQQEAVSAGPEPQATEADQIIIQGTDPELVFDDTDESVDFEIESDAGLLRIQDSQGPTRFIGIEAASAADSIYVQGGSVSLFTSTAGSGVELHVSSDDDFPVVRLEDPALVGGNAQTWDLQVLQDDFKIVDQTGSIPTIFPPHTVLEIDKVGATYTLTFAGNVALGSSREIKTGLEPAPRGELLAALEELPLFTWSYKADPEGARHLGPVAEDFHALFGLGRDARHLSPADTAGLALAAAQELAARLRQKETEIAGLTKRLEEQERRLRELAESTTRAAPEEDPKVTSDSGREPAKER